MFTGIIQRLGKIAAIDKVGGDVKLGVECTGLELADVQLGDSIAVNGVCLTAIELGAGTFAADVSVETLQATSLSSLAVGSPVNLEKSLTPTTALGGHLVSGHVDGLATITAQHTDARSTRFEFELPAALAKYVARKGSICIDGVSLTVNGAEGRRFDVNIIPHTISHTLFQYYKPGVSVNIEVDVIARYVERMLRFDSEEHAGGLSMNTLAENGYTDK